MVWGLSGGPGGHARGGRLVLVTFGVSIGSEAVYRVVLQPPDQGVEELTSSRTT